VDYNKEIAMKTVKFSNVKKQFDDSSILHIEAGNVSLLISPAEIIGLTQLLLDDLCRKMHIPQSLLNKIKESIPVSLRTIPGTYPQEVSDLMNLVGQQLKGKEKTRIFLNDIKAIRLLEDIDLIEAAKIIRKFGFYARRVPGKKKSLMVIRK
jgi:hypothetical protein